MGEVRNLNILTCEVGYQGQSARGPYTIYNVTAEGVSVRLNSFCQLQLGEGAYSVTAAKASDGGDVYTLAPIDGTGSRSDQMKMDLDALTEIVKDLRERIERLEAR